MKNCIAGPQLSIIIPTYNRARLLERCLHSVLACQLGDIEILVSDNASPDDTQDVLQTFRDPRLHFSRNKTNLGFEANMLKLLRSAAGEWIFCLTDDDFLLPNALERLLMIIKCHPDIGVILSNFQVVDQDGNYLNASHYYDKTVQFSPGMEALSRMVWAAHVFSRITVRRKWLDIVGTERHLATMYPQMYFVGAILKEHHGFFLNECLVAHTTGNQVFWEYTQDFMVGPRLKMFSDLLPGTRWAKERQVLTKQMIDVIVTFHMQLSWEQSVFNWLTHQIAILRHPEIGLSPSYWWHGVIAFLGLKAATKVRELVQYG